MKKNNGTTDIVVNPANFITISTTGMINNADFNLFSHIVDNSKESFQNSMFFWDGGRYYFHFHKTEVDMLVKKLKELNPTNQRIEDWITDIIYLKKDSLT